MKTALLFVVLAHGADVGTSLSAFQRGAHEGNPLFDSARPAVLTVGVAAGTTGEVLALRALAKQHPKLAKTIAWVSVGVRGAIAVHNARVR